MAFGRDTYTASGGSQTDFTITYSYIAEAHVTVFVQGVLQTEGGSNDYTIVTAGTVVRFNATVTDGKQVVLLRDSSRTTRVVDYANASTITESDLDNDSFQAFYMAQEAFDAADLIQEADKTLALADDVAVAIAIPDNVTTGVFEFIVQQSPELAVSFTWRAEAGAAEINSIYNLTSGTMVLTTGALAGTTGTDVKITLSSHTDKKIYVENRSGAAIVFGYSFRNST